MRFQALCVAVALALPGAAWAGKSKPASKPSAGSKKSGGGSSGSGKPASKGGGSTAKPPKNPTSAVAGALSDSDRPVPGAPAPGDAAPAPKGPQRIDFDDRVIEGQSNKSGAVYLYDRKDLQVESMVKQPSTFRSEIAKGLVE